MASRLLWICTSLAGDSRWRSGAPLSAIDGAAFGVKANIAVAGLPFHGGIGAYRNRIAVEDAAAVALLRRAGAIPIGILNMHEGALGATTDNPFFGKCRNPWNAALTPGGSSGGSAAAVAAGLCRFAFGTDTMGSVRIPSAYCGVAGHKPTFNAIPTEGLAPLSPTLAHIGFPARDARDLRTVLGMLMELAPPRSGRVKVGLAHWGSNPTLDGSCAEGWREASRLLAEIADTTPVDMSGFDLGGLRRKGLLVSEVEGHLAHRDMLGAARDGFSDSFAGLLDWGARQPRARIDAAYEAIRAAGARLEALFESIDVIATPTAPQGPFPFEAPVPADQADFTALANFAGAPACAVPAIARGAPPPSIQFIGRRGADALVLDIAEAFEAARGRAPSAP